jgi:hypothetical protein
MPTIQTRMKLGIALVDLFVANCERFDIFCLTQPDTWRITFHSDVGRSLSESKLKQN